MTERRWILYLSAGTIHLVSKPIRRWEIVAASGLDCWYAVLYLLMMAAG
jgi:hypothetical protein